MNKYFKLMGYGQEISGAVVAVLFFLTGTFSGWAHAQLIKSDPPDKVELKESPARVDLWFNELLDENFNSIEIIPAAEISAPKHANFAKGKPKVDPADRTHLSVRVTELKPGKYVIQYRVLSRDGHTAPGRITFQVREPKT
jgi:methionine-rich copper-binding protein CopC